MSGYRPKTCKDCAAEGLPRTRPAPHPGPRCATHWRAEVKARKARAADRHLVDRHDITPEQYAAVLAQQEDRCYLCRRRPGSIRRLAVDHDHVLAAGHPHAVERACPECFRGLACTWCNRELLPRLGEDPATYARIVTVLARPPGRTLLLAGTRPPEDGSTP